MNFNIAPSRSLLFKVEPTQRSPRLLLRWLVSGLLGGASIYGASILGAMPAQAQITAQPEEPAPTVRYARGEDVDLAEIIAEWRGYYDDVPIYLCVCQDDTCDQTDQWPYREYGLYELGVALGPNNGRVAEASGASCVDIADGSGPDEPREFSVAEASASEESVSEESSSSPPAEPERSEVPEPETPQPAAAPPTGTQMAASGNIPRATTINDGSDIRLDWPSGSSNTIQVAGSTWNINVLNALDCSTTSVVNSKTMVAQRVVGQPAVDAITGNVAVPVLLDSCVETDQSAVFVLDPSEGGGYALYRTQLPASGAGSNGFPNEFSSSAFSSISDVSYWEGALLVKQGTASGAEAIAIFRSGRTPAGEYAGCGVVTAGEGANRLCAD